MKKLSVGDKFVVRNREYITCMIGGLYYFVNTSNGNLWSDGLEYEYAVFEINTYGFKKVN